jgi:hypothetical protein
MPQTPQRLALKRFLGVATLCTPKNLFRVGMQAGGGSLGRQTNGEAWAYGKMGALGEIAKIEVRRKNGQ